MLLLNNNRLHVLVYPNNETLLTDGPGSVTLTLPRGRLTVTLKFESNADLFHLALLRDHLRAHGRIPDLEIPYMPYSRADRSQEGSVFSLRTAVKLIAPLEWGTITIWEPHSEVTRQEFANHGKGITVVNWTVDALPKVMRELHWSLAYDTIVLPDAGAAERYLEQTDIFRVANTISVTKERNFTTGTIEKITLPEGHYAAHRTSQALIIDDLCSKGGTFVGTADLLREAGYQEVYLLVTHMEQVGYNRRLMDSVDGIYTSDSITPPEAAENIHVLPYHLLQGELDNA